MARHFYAGVLFFCLGLCVSTGATGKRSAIVLSRKLDLRTNLEELAQLRESIASLYERVVLEQNSISFAKDVVEHRHASAQALADVLKSGGVTGQTADKVSHAFFWNDPTRPDPLSAVLSQPGSQPQVLLEPANDIRMALSTLLDFFVQVTAHKFRKLQNKLETFYRNDDRSREYILYNLSEVAKKALSNLLVAAEVPNAHGLTEVFFSGNRPLNALVPVSQSEVLTPLLDSAHALRASFFPTHSYTNDLLRYPYPFPYNVHPRLYESLEQYAATPVQFFQFDPGSGAVGRLADDILLAGFGHSNGVKVLRILKPLESQHSYVLFKKTADIHYGIFPVVATLEPKRLVPTVASLHRDSSRPVQSYRWDRCCQKWFVARAWTRLRHFKH